MKSVSMTNISGKLTLEVYGNGIKLSADDAVIIVDGAATTSDVAAAATPTGYLAPSYFTSDELRAAINAVKPAQAVTCDGSMLWPGKGPTLMYGTAANLATVNIMNPQDLPQPPLVPPVITPKPPAPPVTPPPSTGFVGAPLSGPSAKDRIITVPWPVSGQGRSESSGFYDGRVAFKVTVPGSVNASRGTVNTGQITGSQTAFREVTITRSPNDFEKGPFLYDGRGNPDTGPYIAFSVNDPASGLPNLSPGETVYFNFRNAFNGRVSCEAASDIYFDFAPRGA